MTGGRGVEIVAMEQRHLDRLAELEAMCFSTPWSRKALEEELDNPNAVFLVAEEEGAPLGYAGMHCAAGEGYVDNVAVFPAARNGRGPHEGPGAEAGPAGTRKDPAGSV